MSRIESCIEKLKSGRKKLAIPYIVAGDPHPDVTVRCMETLVEQGADIIELGVPFSDPMAEGPVIQRAHERALHYQVSLADVLNMVKQFRQRNEHTPVVLMGYANPVVAMGYQTFAERAHTVGVDGVLTVDLPPEEAVELNHCLAEKAIDTIFLVAPTTSSERVAQICKQATGYIYYVSLKGVTGAGHLDTREVEQNVKRIRQQTDLPVCVGFGIKDAHSASVIAACADGIVIGSALVESFANELADPAQLLSALGSRFSDIIADING